MIRVSEPLVGELEKKYLMEAIDSGEISSGGSFVRRFEEAFAKWSGNDYAVAVSSGTAALETGIWSLGLDEISIPVGTIISCYVAALRAGAKVNFHDNKRVLRDSVMRVHLFGREDHSSGYDIVDDCSQYWLPFRVTDVGCYSLYANKLITCGEGGVLVMNDKRIYDFARSYRNLCHSEERFIHDDIGYNFRMSNLQAAVALAQLEQIDKFTRIKKVNSNTYYKMLPAEVRSLFRTEVPWMYLVRTRHNAGQVVMKMAKEGVQCRRFFYPLNQQPRIKAGGSYPIAEDLWEHAFYLPSGLNLKEEDIAHVCGALKKVLRDV